MFGKNKKLPYICTAFAEIAQLVERNLAKVEVAGSSLVFRSLKIIREIKRNYCPGGGIGRHAGLKILSPSTAVRVQVPPRALFFFFVICGNSSVGRAQPCQG
jgi:hypothetical protein